MNDATMNRAIGQIEGELKGIVATLARVDERSAARDEAFEEIREELRTVAADIATLKKQAADQIIVTQKFNELQQAIRDGKMTGKGVVIGIGLAGGAVGATVATFFKTLWAAVFGA